MEEIPNELVNPIELPKDEEEERYWQSLNKLWWEKFPMRYDWRERIHYEEFSREFFLEIDKRFFNDARNYMKWKTIPFDNLIDYYSLRDQDVLEIGIGSGSHAQLIAKYSKSFTGIDITEYAIKSTSERMRIGGLSAVIKKMEAENMRFDDNTFDFIWTWGVIHHSANTKKILKEMARVLKIGGKAICMVYHRNFWNYYIINGFLRGIIKGDFVRNKSISINKIMQISSDGAIARHYTMDEWDKLVSEYFTIKNKLIFGQKTDLIPLPSGMLKNLLINFVPNSLTTFLTNSCKLGSLLVTTLEKT